MDRFPFCKYDTNAMPIVHFCYDMLPYTIRYWWSKEEQKWLVGLWEEDEYLGEAGGIVERILQEYINLKERVWNERYDTLCEIEQKRKEKI